MFFIPLKFSCYCYNLFLLWKWNNKNASIEVTDCPVCNFFFLLYFNCVVGSVVSVANRWSDKNFKTQFKSKRMKFNITRSFPIFKIISRQLCIWNGILMFLIVFLFEFLGMNFNCIVNEEIRVDVTVYHSMGNIFFFKCLILPNVQIRRKEMWMRRIKTVIQSLFIV